MIWVGLIGAIFCLIAGPFIGGFLSEKAGEKLSLNPSDTLRGEILNREIDIEPELLNSAVKEFSSHYFSDPDKVMQVVDKFPTIYPASVKLHGLDSTLLSAVAKKVKSREKLVKFIQFGLFMSATGFFLYLYFALAGWVEPQAKLQSIKDSVSSTEVSEGVAEVNHLLIEVRELTNRLATTDSISETKLISESLLLKGSEITELLEEQKEENTLAAALLESELKDIRAQVDKLNVMQSLEEEQREIVRDYYFSEAVKSGSRSFYLGIIATVLVQLLFLFLTPWIWRLFPKFANGEASNVVTKEKIEFQHAD